MSSDSLFWAHKADQWIKALLPRPMGKKEKTNSHMPFSDLCTPSAACVGAHTQTHTTNQINN